METQNPQTLLILKNAEFNTQSLTQFLIHRDWKIHTAHNVSDALKLLLDNKPAFLMISTDHKDPGALKLGRVIQQHIPLGVIHFAEQDSLNAIKNLEKSDSIYKIFPPIAGPAIERIIAKYNKDLTHTKLDLTIIKTGNKASHATDEAFAIRGSNDLDGEVILTEIADKNTDYKALEDSMHIALDTICNQATHLSTNCNIQSVTNVNCMVIHSRGFSGYMLTATSENNPIDKHLAVEIKNFLMHMLAISNEQNLSQNFQMDLKINKVNFADWSHSFAEFSKKSVHNGQEIAMAFFPHSEAKIRCGPSAHEDMTTISLSEVVCDAFLDFNVYLYLAKNDRYVLYTPKGGILYTHQKDKLLQQRIESLHVKKVDLPAVAALKALSFLNDKVSKFQNGQIYSE